MAERKLSPERRARILEAARGLILRHGLRATTMEAIAREAQIAKPTLYGYFPDKEAVFGGIVQGMVDQIREAVGTALAGEGDVVVRIAAALTAKYDVIGDVLAGSPHGDELYSEHDRGKGGQFEAVEVSVEDGVAAALRKAGVKDARQLTQLLLAAAYGVGRKARAPAGIGPAITTLVERLVRPELAE